MAAECKWGMTVPELTAVSCRNGRVSDVFAVEHGVVRRMGITTFPSSRRVPRFAHLSGVTWMNLRPVKQVLEELVRYVEPPRGVAIFLTESIPSSASDLNWVRWATGVQCNDRFEHKLAGLRKSDPIVDWSGIDEHGAQRWRIVRWVSEHTPQRLTFRGFRVRERGNIKSITQWVRCCAWPHSAFRSSINFRRS